MKVTETLDSIPLSVFMVALLLGPLFAVHIGPRLAKALFFNVTYWTNPRDIGWAIPQAVIALVLIWTPLSIAINSFDLLAWVHPDEYAGNVDPSGSLFTMINSAWAFIMLWPGLFLTSHFFSTWRMQHRLNESVAEFLAYVPSWAIVLAVVITQAIHFFDKPEVLTATVGAVLTVSLLSALTSSYTAVLYPIIAYSAILPWVITHTPMASIEPLQAHASSDSGIGLFALLALNIFVIQYAVFWRAEFAPIEAVMVPESSRERFDSDADLD